MRRLVVSLIAALFVAAVLAPSAGADPSEYGFKSVSASLSSVQAGAHPDFTTTLELKTDSEGGTFARTRDLTVDLPPGLIGNPNSVPQCAIAQFQLALVGGSGCPLGSQVGVTHVEVHGLGNHLEPVYVLKPPSRNIVARLAFWAVTFPTYIDVRVRSESDYGVTADLEGISAQAELISATTTLWGVPAAEGHDSQRITPKEGFEGIEEASPPRPSGQSEAPFLSNPTSCGPLQVDFAIDSYALPGQPSKASAPMGSIIGCEKLNFEPSLTVTPTSHQAASPSGLDVEVKIPQDEKVNTLATSELRDATVTLPAGMTVAAGAAEGLQACSAAQASYKEPGPSNCPEAAKIGSASFVSPALPELLRGAVYQRTPREEGNLLGIWLVANDLGVNVKIPGVLHANPQTGQLTSLFIGNPQLPLSQLELHIKGGSHAPLATPSACGTYFTHWEFAPWSGNAAVKGDASMTIDEGCDTGAFSPKLSAGSANPVAGTFSDFVTDLTRESGEQNPIGLDVTLPPGVLAKLAGVAICEGAAAESGSCPTASQVGSTAVAAGPGPTPLWIPQPGKEPTAIYFAGPYKGAPYSLVIKTPAQAGPFDLGTVVVRAAIDVDPETAQVTVHSDPLPQILEGVPISYRDVHVEVNRHDFTLNPTSCEPMKAEAKVTSSLGAIANPTSRFQVGGCERLPFKPKLSLRLHGKTNRGAHPSLRATLAARPGDANIARAQVTLPRSEFLDQGHIRTVCTRVQFAVNQCPAGSVYGHAKAITPLLAQPLEGPVYLRSSKHPLPDLVADLNGQIQVVLAGRVDSVNQGIRTTFATVPDAPVTKFVLSMQGGKKGLLVNSEGLCGAPARAIVKLDGQNGKAADQKPLLQDDCAKKAHKGNSKKH